MKNNLMIKKASELSGLGGNDWLVEDVLPARSLVLLSAPPKLGKTMVALELSTALASGKKAFGIFNVPKKGKVLYFAGEDAEGGFKKRIDQFSKGKNADTDELEIYTVTEQTLLVDTPEGQAALCGAIESVKPDLLVLDNLSRIHHSNENNAIAVGMIFEFLQSIKLKYGITILLVHHMGKDGTLRGSSQIDSYYEAALFLKARDNGRVIDFKFRNYEERLGVGYRIVTEDGAMHVALTDSEEPLPEPAKASVIPMHPTIRPKLNITDAVAHGTLVQVREGVYKRVV